MSRRLISTRPFTTSVSFTATGTTTWTVPAGVTSVAVLVVGGGGGGGNGATSSVSNVTGAGGGAGGVVYNPSFSVTPGANLTVTVGSGGTAQSNGGNSVFSTITAYGGDGSYSGAVGSGIGGIWETGTSGAGHILPTSGTAGQGNAGGDCYTGATTAQASTTSGGGGGANAAGSTASAANTGGNGGSGKTITLPLVSYTLGGGGGGGAGNVGTVGTATQGGGAGGTQRNLQNTFAATILANSKSVTLTTGSTSSLAVGDMIIPAAGSLSRFSDGTIITGITSGTVFTIDKFPIISDFNVIFGTYIPAVAGTANTGGGGGGAGRPGTNPGFALPGGSGGSGLVVINY